MTRSTSRKPRSVPDWGSGSGSGSGRIRVGRRGACHWLYLLRLPTYYGYTDDEVRHGRDHWLVRVRGVLAAQDEDRTCMAKGSGIGDFGGGEPEHRGPISLSLALGASSRKRCQARPEEPGARGSLQSSGQGGREVAGGVVAVTCGGRVCLTMLVHRRAKTRGESVRRPRRSPTSGRGHATAC
eukprot:scaffold38134_cov36-Phaeocystis_antarctica.AAC.1